MESLISTHGLRDMIEEYTGGRCYYPAFIGHSGRTEGSQGGSGIHIYRNYAFTVTISSFSHIGASRLTDLKLNYPPTWPEQQGKTWLTTEIEMEDWNSYDTVEGL
jgi:hypothetical protein